MQKSHAGTLRRAAGAMITGGMAALGLAGRAMAQPWPHPIPRHPQVHVVIHTVVVGGMRGWHAALIALSAAFAAAAIAVAVDRERARRRHLAAGPLASSTAGGPSDSEQPVVTLGPGRW
jgi:hypothetical protein